MAPRCRDAMSPGITRGFPRLCPTAGLVTVALLTLAPLALRPVRLACLIHAANVHSEPGSNPSKWSRVGSRGLAAALPAPAPHLEEVEEKYWSQRAPVAARPWGHPAPATHRRSVLPALHAL